MPKLDLDALPVVRRTGYPPPLDAVVAGRSWRELGATLTDIGVNLVTLEPGAASSLRHWHTAEDELVYMLSGEAILVEDDGETILRAGDVAVFPKNAANGHHLVNRSEANAVFIAVGTDRPDEDHCTYPDSDLFWSAETGYVAASSLAAVSVCLRFASAQQAVSAPERRRSGRPWR